MNVGQLKNYLNAYPDDLEIAVASDEEGNSYSTLYTIQAAFMDSELDYAYDPDEVVESQEDEDGDHIWVGHVKPHLIIWPA